MAPKVGAEAEVPPTGVTWPFMMTVKCSEPSAAASGVPRPLALYEDGLGSLVMVLHTREGGCEKTRGL